MKRMSLLIVLLSLAPVANAVDSLRDKLTSYQKIEITPFRNKVGENLDEKTVSDLQTKVTAEISESGLLKATFNSDLPFPKRDADDDSKLAFAGTGNSGDEKTLVLFTEIITFNKGSRAKRYFAGGGSGRAEIRGNCFLMDKSTGKQIFTFQSFGETNWGLMGGGADKTLKGYASRVVGFLKGKY